MKGVVVEGVGSPYKYVGDLKVPEPDTDQILVKSIAAATNPVYVEFSLNITRLLTSPSYH